MAGAETQKDQAAAARAMDDDMANRMKMEMAERFRQFNDRIDEAIDQWVLLAGFATCYVYSITNRQQKTKYTNINDYIYICTRSSATAEKQRVSCPQWGGGG